MVLVISRGCNMIRKIRAGEERLQVLIEIRREVSAKGPQKEERGEQE